MQGSQKEMDTGMRCVKLKFKCFDRVQVDLNFTLTLDAHYSLRVVDADTALTLDLNPFRLLQR